MPKSLTRRALLTLGLLASFSLPLFAQQKTLHVAAAADLTPVLPALAAKYQQATGIRIIPSFASSATLEDQLRNGAPFDVFLSADVSHAQHLAAAGLTDDPQPIPYAHGVLVLWARKDSPAQPISLAALNKPAVTKIAIANQLLAPYGLAAVQALQHLNLYKKLAPKLVIAENIAQTAQFAYTGNAQAGFIALTTAITPQFAQTGTYVGIPTLTYSPLIQSAVIMKSSRNLPAARAFLQWLTSPAIQQTLKQYGLDPAK